jgi:hypothetical protein
MRKRNVLYLLLKELSIYLLPNSVGRMHGTVGAGELYRGHQAISCNPLSSVYLKFYYPFQSV